MPRDYEQCERIESIAKRLIDGYHEHLKPAKISYIMKTFTEAESFGKKKKRKVEAAIRSGKHPRIACARLVSKLYHLITSLDFIVEVDEKRWDKLSIPQQEAVVDHELCHCRRDSKGFYLQDHDVEEFRVILERHGFWQPRIEEFMAVQPKLPFDQVTVQKTEKETETVSSAEYAARSKKMKDYWAKRRSGEAVRTQ